jgi:hypothetical protein
MRFAVPPHRIWLTVAEAVFDSLRSRAVISLVLFFEGEQRFFFDIGKGRLPRFTATNGLLFSEGEPTFWFVPPQSIHRCSFGATRTYVWSPNTTAASFLDIRTNQMFAKPLDAIKKWMYRQKSWLQIEYTPKKLSGKFPSIFCESAVIFCSCDKILIDFLICVDSDWQTQCWLKSFSPERNAGNCLLRKTFFLLSVHSSIWVIILGFEQSEQSTNWCAHTLWDGW